MNRDDRTPVNLSRAAAARVGAAARWAERFDRAPVNLTPAISASAERDRETAVWPARVTALPTTSLSDPELTELYFGTVYLPDSTTGTRFEEYECWIRPIPGGALEVGSTGLARLTGWKESSAGNEAKPVYTLIPGDADGCTKYRTVCLDGALIRQRCEVGSGGASWVFDALLGTCDPRTPASTGSSGGSGSGGTGQPPVDLQPGAAPVRFPFVRKVCPGDGPCQSMTEAGGPDQNVSVASWIVKISAGDDINAVLPAWSAGLCFRFIRVSVGSQTVNIVAQSGETINGAAAIPLAGQYSAVEVEAGCVQGEWFAFRFAAP